MLIKKVKITEIIPAHYNPRQISRKELNKLKESIKKFGLVQPLIINKKTNSLVGGHQRLTALIELGYKEAECIFVNLTDEEEKTLNIALNKVSGEWDFTKLKGIMAELENNGEMSIMSGFDQVEIDALLGRMSSDSFFGADELNEKPKPSESEPPAVIAQTDSPIVSNIVGEAPATIPEDNEETLDPEIEDEPEKEPVCQIGDIWQLGKHRLFCGDSTDVDSLRVLFGKDLNPSLVLTDPPYGVDIVKDDNKLGSNNVAKANKYAKIIGDDTTDTAKKFYDACSRLWLNNIIIWGGNYFTDFLPSRSCWLVWDKENTGDYADVELAWTSFKTAARLYKWLWNGMCRKGSKELELKKRIHPTQKPVGLLIDVIMDYSKENDVIFDGFLGSGSTLIACEKAGRVCVGAELSPVYCDLIIERWETLTGEKASKLNV